MRLGESGQRWWTFYQDQLKKNHVKNYFFNKGQFGSIFCKKRETIMSSRWEQVKRGGKWVTFVTHNVCLVNKSVSVNTLNIWQLTPNSLLAVVTVFLTVFFCASVAL